MTEFSNTEEYIEDVDFEHKDGGGWKDRFWGFIESRYFMATVFVLMAIVSFSLGRISGLQDKKPAVKIISENLGEVKGVTTVLVDPINLQQTSLPQSVLSSSSGQVVASKNGTKYHYPWCAGAKQISAKNLVTFNSIDEARAKGYTPASNCKGLK
ncbi:MAG: hypothetical protein A3A96_00065 [Candidatus Zambryskibacteria bacterium RIFCSPLOWO2_01_FULL_39_39]|uniref:Ada DNA repair metal-binding domain-containing protein n=1 Tax=Candidatus Zambryskibacteria bacterium RIFCSPLOWO2_01_FULL_39_39 TaxID=1802758 RepID=A0A1G2TZ34_9BACT|nr:MAG: Extracellular nuclease [Parcubacteria group bacterium GW2011_GWA1_38_7]OHA87480.1 MAG: hypothetical protein A2644_02880 [Candidatus Zambryskibacteria bacterium RIFCSPHIGHO2_01_FULL_39_63]OHA94882.1 MAG: hypothetical protein A3B88_00690 [Candidatus Zambryskibacteria bacterium RIFCSPHIGHO2_02_FULL_39_19]OHA99062.1 MAG: hypothetical protein A3F20_02640 [Candidatus Zambryskibacteria bacterium RIFCSPHIGHO2_12_FULL_39_21]OHB01822.1 MAG: hypothetical protein A3A96_00065 [Candidatus Zambryskiba